MNNLVNEIAIIVPSYKRQQNLERIGKYYENFGMNVYILDSSPLEAKVSLPSNVIYKWMPQYNFSHKIRFQIESLNNIPFIALIADDDFVKYETLLECYEVMKGNKKLVMSNGVQYLFNQEYDRRIYYNPSANGFEGINVIKNDDDGIRYYWKNYQNIIWSLFRKDVLLDAFKKLVECNFTSGNFPELLISIEVLRHGNVYMSEQPFNFMEINPNEHWGTTSASISWPSYWTVPSLKKDVLIFKKFFRKDELAMRCLKLHMGNPFKVFINVFLRYLKSQIRRLIKLNRNNETTGNGILLVSDDIMLERLSKVLEK